MKKYIKNILKIILLLAIFTMFTCSVKATYYGDVDKDGKVTAADARLILRYSAGLQQFTDEQKCIADFDHDGNVNSSDARTALRTASKLERLKEIKVQKAEFTAYYPSNSGVEGGYYDCIGNRLDPSKNTCAAPKNLPYGTKIKVEGTGTSIDGKIYTVTDRGGAIRILNNGTYRIDILMGSSRECNNFGRRSGKITIYYDI